MVAIILIIGVSTLLTLGPALLIRFLARLPFYWTFNPANTFSAVVTDEDKSGSGMSGGGNIVDVLHAVPGMRLDKSSDNPMEWYFERGDDSDHEAFLYRALGVQSMGSPFHTTRLNVDKRERFARENDKDTLHTVTKIYKTRNVFYSGELTVSIKEADTADRLGLDFEIDFAFERKFPVRSILRLADAAAFLTSLAENIVNNHTVTLPAEAFIGGSDTQTHREELVRRIESDDILKEKALREIGFDITSVSLRDVTMSERHRALLELKVEAEKRGEALVIEAEKKRDAAMALIEADAKRVQEVIIPAAQNERTVEVRKWEAYEKNTTVRTFAPGADTMVPLGEESANT